MQARSLTHLICLAVLASAAFLSGCSSVLRATPAQAVLADPNGVTLPTRRCANYFLVDVRLNGRGPFTMIVDTGASQTAVTPRVARMLRDDARPAEAIYAEDSQGRHQDIAQLISIRDLKIGDAELRGFDAIVVDLSRIQATLGTPIDGILGYPAFGDVLLTIDYPGSAIRVSRGELPRPDGKRILPLASRSTPQIPVQIDGRNRTLLLDTGMAGGFSLKDFDDQRFASPPATIALGVAVGGSYPMRAGRLAGDITFGDIAFKHPIVMSSQASDLVGAEALKSLVVVLDQRRNRVMFSSAGEPQVTFPPIRGIGVGFDYADGFWRVAQVFPGQPGEAAGLHPGDGIIRLGDKRLRDLACTRVAELFDAGDAIDVAIIRERRRMEFKVPIATLVP